MITVTEFAALHNAKPNTVRKWCRKGLIGAARYDCAGGVTVWLIPPDAQPPRRTAGRPRKVAPNG